MCPHNTGNSRSAPPPAATAPPPVLVPAVYKLNEWSAGLCGCCCVRAGLVYCLLAVVCCPCLYTCTYRRKLRIMYGLKEEPCADYFLHCCCHLCAICQEYRELQNRGFDPSIGWLANADRLNRGGASPMAPPTMATPTGR
ncbi:hypothetical protein V6N13_042007 [Hibiscus sabdariffa]|uniref:Uncharacterized protein n=1 Tax=Hibiscus sabdariffa TaxID=183260 RepID=A0ABR2DE50_9ROSI